MTVQSAQSLKGFCITPVILCGGAGTRLWPLSRKSLPKPLQPLLSDQTLLQETARRVAGPPFGPPIVVCAEETRFIVAEQLRDIGIAPRALIVEPAARGTAPAAAAAAHMLGAQRGELMLILPSDHMIRYADRFRAAVAQALPAAQSGRIVTFGIAPNGLATGFGYIKRGAPQDGAVFAIDKFIEKPSPEAAQALVDSGDCFWNSGIFLADAASFLAELEKGRPGMGEICAESVRSGMGDLDFFRLGEIFGQTAEDSIDYAVMEQTDKGAVIPADLGWSDIGAWDTLWHEAAQDENQNVLRGDIVTLDTSGCYLRSETDAVLATIGLRDLVVVATADAILVADRAQDQQVKQIVTMLGERGADQALSHRRIFRPWGWYETMERGDRFHVKHIMVKPGAKLSSQKHWHRSEHWIIVAGTAMVAQGGRNFILRENESTFIPAGTVHRLENPGKLPLRLIEVQSGPYLEEDDIVRLDDVYGRVEG